MGRWSFGDVRAVPPRCPRATPISKTLPLCSRVESMIIEFTWVDFRPVLGGKEAPDARDPNRAPFGDLVHSFCFGLICRELAAAAHPKPQGCGSWSCSGPYLPFCVRCSAPWKSATCSSCASTASRTFGRYRRCPCQLCRQAVRGTTDDGVGCWRWRLHRRAHRSRIARRREEVRAVDVKPCRRMASAAPGATNIHGRPATASMPA